MGRFVWTNGTPWRCTDLCNIYPGHRHSLPWPYGLGGVFLLNVIPEDVVGWPIMHGTANPDYVRCSLPRGAINKNVSDAGHCRAWVVT